MAINTDNLVKSATSPEGIPPKVSGQQNIYKPSDIKRWGISHFLAEIAPKEPVQPNFTFTAEEQCRMDEILAARESA